MSTIIFYFEVDKKSFTAVRLYIYEDAIGYRKINVISFELSR